MDVPGRCLGTCDAQWLHPHISHDVLAIHDGIMELLAESALIDFVLKLFSYITLHKHVPHVWMHHEGLQSALMRHGHRAQAHARANVYTPALLTVQILAATPPRWEARWEVVRLSQAGCMPSHDV